MLSDLIYKFSAIPLKILEGYFVTIDRLTLNLIQKSKRPRVANRILERNRVRGLTLPDFKIYYKVTILKAFDCVDHSKLWKILKEM